MPVFAPLDESKLKASREILERAIARRAFPGAVLAVGHQSKLAAISAGRLSYGENSPNVSAETIYDIASLTKAVATTTAAMILMERGALSLDAPVSRYLPDFMEPYDTAADPLWSTRAEVTLRHLLAHTSGLPAYERFFLRARKKAHVIDEAVSLPLEDPPGFKTLYSDVGFILLGEIVEQAAKEALDGFCEREIFHSLAMQSTCFNPGQALRSRIAPTEQDDAFRKRLICGEVHDENAWVMGGVAGHAGLFGTAGDLAAFCQMMLEGGTLGGQRIINTEAIQKFTRAWPAQNGTHHETARGLGWDKPSQPSSSGRYFSAAAYGHLGFTGTSIWIDPEKQLFVILLTNRVHPTRANELIREVRPALHDAVVEALQK